MRDRETIEEILPSSQILDKFEDAVPGSVAKLIDMAKKEQEQRHEWQSNYLKSHNFSTRIGQLFGLIYNIGLLFVIYDLINNGEKELAIKLFAINAALIAFVILFTTFERKVFSRRPRVRGRDNRNSNSKNPRKDNNRDSSRTTREPREQRKPREQS
jgi:uncharacterized membrane protein